MKLLAKGAHARIRHVDNNSLYFGISKMCSVKDLDGHSVWKKLQLYIMEIYMLKKFMIIVCETEQHLINFKSNNSQRSENHCMLSKTRRRAGWILLFFHIFEICSNLASHFLFSKCLSGWQTKPVIGQLATDRIIVKSQEQIRAYTVLVPRHKSILIQFFPSSGQKT